MEGVTFRGSRVDMKRHEFRFARSKEEMKRSKEGMNKKTRRKSG